MAKSAYRLFRLGAVPGTSTANGCQPSRAVELLGMEGDAQRLRRIGWPLGCHRGGRETSSVGCAGASSPTGTSEVPGIEEPDGLSGIRWRGFPAARLS